MLKALPLIPFAVLLLSVLSWSHMQRMYYCEPLEDQPMYRRYKRYSLMAGIASFIATVAVIFILVAQY